MIPKTEAFRKLMILMAAMWFALPSWGVLSEYDLGQTLISLECDMKVLRDNIKRDIQRFENRRLEFRNEIDRLEETCNETGVMLYSQDERYMFGILQATQAMNDVVRRIRSEENKISLLENDLSIISNRYNELSRFLQEIEDIPMTPKVGRVIKSSIVIADSLRLSVDSCLAAVTSDKSKYSDLLRKADRLEAYSNKVMDQMQKNIFVTGNDNFSTILSHFSFSFKEFIDDLEWRFLTGQSATDDWISKEDRMVDYINKIDYIAIAIALCLYIFARFTRTRFCPARIVRLCPGWIADKPLYWALALWMILNIVCLALARLTIGVSPMLRIELMLKTELYLLALVILFSTTIRHKKGKIGRALVSYLPMYFLTFLFVSYREDLVTMSTLTFTAPWFFIVALIGQIIILVFNLKKLDSADRWMIWANLIVILGCTVTVICGYTMLGVLMMLLWGGLVTGILAFGLVKEYMDKKNLKKNNEADVTIRALVYPLAIPAIILAAVYWVTHICNLTTWFIDLMNTPFVNMPDKVGVISMTKILNIYLLGVLTNYGLRLAKTILWRNPDNRQGQMAVAISIGSIIVWLFYAIAVVLILNINKAGIIAAVGGASIGIGFALKDTFDNFFSGLSLMTGRLRPGDIMEYDGVRGKVLDIGIVSTSMETEDGPIMTMTNRMLFEKNFRNMTRNHRVEIRHITFDIAADNDPKFVREVILESFRGIDGVDDSRRHVVIMRNFGRNIMKVELKVWIDSDKYLATEPAVREAVYEAFRQHGIEKAVPILQLESGHEGK